MQCYEFEVMRSYLYDCLKNIGYGVARDELALAETLSDCGVTTLQQLMAMDIDRFIAMAEELTCGIKNAA